MVDMTFWIVIVMFMAVGFFSSIIFLNKKNISDLEKLQGEIITATGGSIPRKTIARQVREVSTHQVSQKLCELVLLRAAKGLKANAIINVQVTSGTLGGIKMTGDAVEVVDAKA